MRQSAVSITVFFPCYNEQENIGRVVGRASEVLKGTGADYEIIVVNDGSSDQTGRVADELAAADNHIRVVHHPRNLGYGAALQSGFRSATKQFVFFTDGDGQFDTGEMPALLPFMERFDIVCGYRLNRSDPVIRRLNGWLWTKLVNLLFGMNIRDIDCAFKLFRREVFDHIKMSSSGALISAEILARATRGGYRITQAGVHHYPRTAGKQTGAKLRVIVRAFKELFALYNKIRKGQ
ncbi:MAG: glycosyltransferase family 2 protein [Sedimentisphaerales bacterium]|nr:glycosyltransferase family 2 protein [Sedimentisphaerales bacterium]